MKYIQLTISIAAPLLTGFIGSVFTTPAITGWYEELTKPPLNPPNWIFGPVWTVLYIFMGIALFLIWNRIGTTEDYALRAKIKSAIFIFALQLLLNTTWSIVFFYFRNPGLACIIIVALLLTILWTIWTFYPIHKTAAYLLIPYVLWVSFAAYLNFAIWILN